MNVASREKEEGRWDFIIRRQPAKYTTRRHQYFVISPILRDRKTQPFRYTYAVPNMPKGNTFYCPTRSGKINKAVPRFRRNCPQPNPTVEPAKLGRENVWVEPLYTAAGARRTETYCFVEANRLYTGGRGGVRRNGPTSFSLPPSPPPLFFSVQLPCRYLPPFSSIRTAAHVSTSRARTMRGKTFGPNALKSPVFIR